MLTEPPPAWIETWRPELSAPGLGGGEQAWTKRAGLPEPQGLACPAASVTLVFGLPLGGDRLSPARPLPHSSFKQSSLALICLCVGLLPLQIRLCVLLKFEKHPLEILQGPVQGTRRVNV